MREGVPGSYQGGPGYEETVAGGAGVGNLRLGVSPLVTDDGVRCGQDRNHGHRLGQQGRLHLLLAGLSIPLPEGDLRLNTDTAATASDPSPQSVVRNVPGGLIVS